MSSRVEGQKTGSKSLGVKTKVKSFGAETKTYCCSVGSDMPLGQRPIKFSGLELRSRNEIKIESRPGRVQGLQDRTDCRCRLHCWWQGSVLRCWCQGLPHHQAWRSKQLGGLQGRKGLWRPQEVCRGKPWPNMRSSQPWLVPCLHLPLSFGVLVFWCFGLFDLLNQTST